MREMEVEMCVPVHLRCPISLDLMKDPVTLSSGITYDRQSIESWLRAGNIICPVTRQTLGDAGDLHLIPNYTLSRHIKDWCALQRGSIATPLISAEFSHILSEVSCGQNRREALHRLRVMVEKSYRNRKSIANAALVVARVLCVDDEDLCEEALAILALIAPLDEDARMLLASPSALHCITRILLHGSNRGKINAARMVGELASDQQHLGLLRDAEGMQEGLVQLVKEAVSLSATKAAITAINYMSKEKEWRVKFVKAGAVPLLLEILPDADRTTSERSLTTLNLLFRCAEGLRAAYAHALTVPVIVKRMSKVSKVATESAVSILWSLCRHSSNGFVMLEALQFGAFQKLLLVIQVGCSEDTKNKTTQLLKLFSHYRNEWECVDTLDLKEVKHSF